MFMPMVQGGHVKFLPTVEFIVHSRDTFATSSSSNTHSSVSLGTADAARIVVICTGFQTSNTGAGANSIASITIGGVSATKVVSNKYSDSTNIQENGIWYAAVPTGTTGDIVPTFASTTTNPGNTEIGIYKCLRINTTAYDTGTGNGNPAASTTIDNTANGILIAVTGAIGAGTNIFVGVTENSDDGLNSVWACGSEVYSASGTSRTVSSTISTSTYGSVALAVASFQPAA
mgnify:CR=1 FL=1|tara:strand:- start:67 stop:759 length:693 start_codon:yes stop_codon:yes gene_type:complete